jgi:hypothetical protein
MKPLYPTILKKEQNFSFGGRNHQALDNSDRVQQDLHTKLCFCGIAWGCSAAYSSLVSDSSMVLESPKFRAAGEAENKRPRAASPTWDFKK